MEILITTTENQPPTAVSFHNAAKELGHNPHFIYPVTQSEKQWKELAQGDSKLLIPLYTSLNYLDEDILPLDFLLKTGSAKMLNHPYALAKTRGKDKQLKFFRQYGIPHIESLIMSGRPEQFHFELNKFFEQSNRIVIKPFRGNGGIGILFPNTINKTMKYLNKQFDGNDQRYLIQPYVIHDKEIRVLWHKNKILLAFSKDKGPKALMGNLGKGTKATIINPTELSGEISTYMGMIEEKTSLSFFAVDFILKENQLTVMEINTSPGLVLTSKLYGKDLAKEILEHEVK